MAPSATSTTTTTAGLSEQAARLKLHAPGTGEYKDVFTTKLNKDIENGKGQHTAAKYPNYLPTWDASQRYGPLEPFTHNDPGHAADTSYPDLLPDPSALTHLTPSAGSEVRGSSVQLSALTAAGRAQLAHLVAKRKVVAFRNQDLADQPISDALAFGDHFGRHHIHPTSGTPEGYPEIHLVHRGAGDDAASAAKQLLATRNSSVAWHSDVSYEQQPPGTTFLYVLDMPGSGGGDTLFADAVEAYNRLSPAFQERLHGLTALHSGIEQVNAAVARGSINRRDSVVTEHPIVRTHPVTGEKALYVNPQFTREIVGYKKEESDFLLKFLYDHIAFGADFHVRVRWEPGTVVVWDNRVTQHSALIDWTDGSRRHLARITPQAERPFETPFKA